MNLKSFYQALPAPLRTVVASARGYQLRWWRYGPETERAVQDAADRERWSAGRWQAWQAERLARVLHRAATRVPYYRDHWSRRRMRGDRASWEMLAHWPLVTKDDVRRAPLAFIGDDCDPRRMFHEHTSGTTGTPLRLWFRREAVRSWYALYEARVRGWSGVARSAPWANIGGQQVVGFRQAHPPFWVWNAGLRQLYMSSYHLSRAFAGAYLDALARHDIVYLLGYSSSLHSLAQFALEAGVACPPLRAITSNAEPLHAVQREAIGRAFGTAVRETYGMSEIVCAASECSHGALHLWPEVGMLEVCSDDHDAPVAAGETGRFVCTGLINADMPLIRYVVGDRGALDAPGPACGCERTLPVLAGVDGRSDDVLVTADGRRIGRLDPVFKADLAIREAQIIQETLARLRVLIVPAPGYGPRDAAAVARGLRDRVGDVEVAIELVETIPRSANGKFRAVINRLAARPPAP